ncbi:MAG: hypothetical protein H7X88_09060, partial [Gloeobacteraceae cyanobacterium ES-bin-316]|nr:hypothetical protein [Ferruginibacter sp.]
VKDAGFGKIAAKTALHSNNAFFLHAQIGRTLDTEVPEERVADVVMQEKIEKISEENRFEEKVLFTEPHAAEENHSDQNSVDIAEAQDPLIELKEPEQIKDQLPLFTPLYATDYFASQGIKLGEQSMPDDKLGKQLKSFTDWLKTMKKVHETKLPSGSEVMDLSVQSLAEKSNKLEKVITESMAEVFLQQGKPDKAKEIYEKLSLLNPSKIAYFAAKIDQIQ